jgi:hypothetical protein
MSTLRTKVSQVHGLFLIAIGLLLGLYINSVPYTGFGPYGFMREDLFAIAGLSQAYLLMAIIGLTLRLGSRHSNTGVWNWIGALAHIPPLLASVMYFSSIANVGLGGFVIGSMAMHIIWSVIEVIAAVSKPSPANASTAEAH